ncbi:sugar transferase [Prosthecobacter sp.]|uniref:sugar transferase n=1 Tax=Prosthecobacter sp. TaxID=1965333 RepID=UPI0037849A2D
MQLTELLDTTLLAFCLWFGHYLRADLVPVFFPDAVEIPPIDRFYWVIALVAPFTPIILEARGFYSNIYNKTPARSLRQLAEALAVIGMCIAFCIVFFKWTVESRAVVVFSVALGALSLLLREAWQRDILRRQMASGKGRERVIIAGAQKDLEAFVASMTSTQSAEIEIVGQIDIMQRPISDLVEALHEHSISRVLFAAQHVHFSKIEEAVQACETEGVEAWIAADFFQTAIARPTFDVLGGRLMLVFHSTPQASWELLSKGIVDFVGALILLVLSLPVWLVAIIGIRLGSRGPVFFKQERAGHYGKPFTMWKFRTMHVGAESQRQQLEAHNEMDGPVFKITNDPRIFAFGRWLRRTSIDELPQLINVLRGEMSLVGPRPLPVYEIQRIEKHAQRRRLSVKPGLTCLWQVTGRNGIKNFEEWVALDLKYIDNWSFWLDLRILAQTLPAVIRGIGAS